MDGAAWGRKFARPTHLFSELNPAPATEFFVVMGNWPDGTPVSLDAKSASDSHKH